MSAARKLRFRSARPCQYDPRALWGSEIWVKMHSLSRGRPIEMLETRILFAPQTIGTSFLGAKVSESGLIPPDSMGEVGPTQILICENGRIKVFDKNGVPGGLNETTDPFFAPAPAAGP